MRQAYVEIKEIPGYPGYGASADGTIWTRRPKNGIGPLVEWRKKVATLAPSGYYVVKMPTDRGWSGCRRCRMVAIAFLGLPECPTLQVNHKNGCKGDDRLENLEWVTPSRNIRHAIETGLRPAFPPFRLANHGTAKLNHQKASIVRHASSFGCPKKALAEAFGVDRSVISRVVSGKSWDPSHL